MMKQHDLSFPPGDITGKGRGRVYPYSEDQFQELHKAALSVTGDDRKQLLDAYNIGYATLQKKVGVSPQSRKKASARRSSTTQPTSVFDQLQSLMDNVDTALADLDSEQQQLQQRIEEIEQKKSKLRKIADMADA